MSILKNEKKEFVISGAFYLLVGVLMCAWPVGTAGVMCVVAGAALVIGGIMKASGYFRKKDYGLMPRADFASAAIQVIIGIVLASKPDVFIVLVPFILGMMILVNSVFQVQTALELKALKYAGWWHHLVVAGVCGVIALVMMFDPFGSYRMIAIFMGIGFIADGAADLWTALYLTGKLKKLGLM